MGEWVVIGLQGGSWGRDMVWGKAKALAQAARLRSGWACPHLPCQVHSLLPPSRV